MEKRRVNNLVVCSGSHADCPKGCPHRKPHRPRKPRQGDWDGPKHCIEYQVCGAIRTSREGMEVHCVPCLQT
jgi:hypothetical protein